MAHATEGLLRKALDAPRKANKTHHAVHIWLLPERRRDRLELYDPQFAQRIDRRERRIRPQ